MYFSEPPASSPREAVAAIWAQLALIQELERPRYRRQVAPPPPALVGAEAVHDLYRRAEALNQGQAAVLQQPTVLAAQQPTTPAILQQPTVAAAQQPVSVAPPGDHTTMCRSTLGRMDVKCTH